MLVDVWGRNEVDVLGEGVEGVRMDTVGVEESCVVGAVEGVGRECIAAGDEGSLGGGGE